MASHDILMFHDAGSLVAKAKEVLISESSADNGFLLHSLDHGLSRNNGSSDSSGKVEFSLDFGDIETVDNSAESASYLGER